MNRLLLLAGLLTILLGVRAQAVEPFDPFGVAGVDQTPGARVPLEGRFRDADGRPTTLARIADGRPLLIAPVQFDCPNLCGLTLEGLGEAVAGQDYRSGEDFALVALGIDPREGPAQARASQARLEALLPPGGQVTALTGDQAQIAAVTDALGFRYAWDPRIGQYAHVAAVAALTPDGRVARWLFGLAPSAQDVNLALTEAGHRQIGGIVEQVRLLCYHYDPQTGRYSNRVFAALRWGGGLTVLALALLIGAGVRRGRRRA